MLKSTHKPASVLPPLPEGWTEHKAPTGHSYYYNPATKVSTYTRPQAPLVAELQAGVQQSQQPQGIWNNSSSRHGFAPYQDPSHFAGNNHVFRPQRRPEPADRPKSKHPIPGCEPWLLVKTKLGRRFVYNPDVGQSYWKYPPDVLRGVIEFDRLEREKKESLELGESRSVHIRDDLGSTSEVSKTIQHETTAGAEPRPQAEQQNAPRHDEDSDEYEEVEVTDDEDEEAGKDTKRRRVEDEGPLELGEDDIAFQLAAMDQRYDHDPGDQEEFWDETEPLNEEDSRALFKDLLDDFHISPFTPWETTIEDGMIIDDERYTCLPNMKSRKEVFNEWSTERIQTLKEQKAAQAKRDPKIPYFAFLEKHANPKLYWPEFRRKFKKEPELRDTKISDKERERWYREYINRLKLPESTRKADLTILLKSTSLHDLNRSTSMAALPTALLTDIRFITLRAEIRDPLVEAYIAIQPAAPTATDLSREEQERIAREKADRERREQALAEREKKVREEQERRRRELNHSKCMLREGEREIESAMRVGRAGLLGHVVVEENNDSIET